MSPTFPFSASTSQQPCICDLSGDFPLQLLSFVYSCPFVDRHQLGALRSPRRAHHLFCQWHRKKPQPQSDCVKPLHEGVTQGWEGMRLAARGWLRWRGRFEPTALYKCSSTSMCVADSPLQPQRQCNRRRRSICPGHSDTRIEILLPRNPVRFLMAFLQQSLGKNKIGTSGIWALVDAVSYNASVSLISYAKSLHHFAITLHTAS
jgi:hypothetical protein